MGAASLQLITALLQGLDLLAWILTLGPVYSMQQRMKRRTIRAAKVGDAHVNEGLDHPSPIFRSLTAPEVLGSRKSDGVDTLYKLFSRAYTKYANKNALGTRTLLDSKIDAGQRFPTRVFGKTVWQSYKDVSEQAHAFGRGLIELGVKPLHLQAGQSFNDINGPHTILLYEETCANWLIAAQGAFSQSIGCATSYATLGASSIVAAVNEAGITTIFCNYKSVAPILEQKKTMPTLKNIIYNTYGLLPDQIKQHPGRDADVKVYSFEELIEMGMKVNHPADPPGPDDIAIVMYTSGSTGKPKGVTVRHQQIVSCLGTIGERVNLREGEVLVGYLPLAHILEMQLEFYCFGYGGQIGYSDPKSLTGGPGKCEPHGGLAEFRPTIMAAVPKVWEVIKAGAEAKVKAGGATKEALFKAALQWKMAAMPDYRSTPVFDKLVFGKFKEVLGGRLRLAVSGGGAISEEVQAWVRTVFGCPLVQGYGLTETCAGLTLQSPDDWRVGVVGFPIDTVEVLVHSEADIRDSEMKAYLATDTHHFSQPCLGRGEIWVRGTNVTDGYYKMPKETAEAFDKDKWFHTGDIGVILPDGSIKIVDRKKNLVKLKGGEYIALEHMNQAYNTCKLVDTERGGSCSYGDGSMDRPVALIQVHVDNMLALAKTLGIASTDPEVLVKDPKIQDEVTKQLVAIGKSVEPPLSSLETLAGVALLLKSWSPDDGTMTASLKIVPQRIQFLFADELAAVKSKGIR